MVRFWDGPTLVAKLSRAIKKKAINFETKACAGRHVSKCANLYYMKQNAVNGDTNL